MYKLSPIGVMQLSEKGDDNTAVVISGNAELEKAYKEWLDAGNTPLPMYTPEEEAAILLEKAVEQEKESVLATAFPTWAQAKQAIDNAFPDGRQNTVITKMARLMYLHFTGRID